MTEAVLERLRHDSQGSSIETALASTSASSSLSWENLSSNTRQVNSYIIFTNARWETDFIVEWVNYHLWIGFDKIVIRNQDADKSTLQRLLQPYTDARVVELVDAEYGSQFQGFVDFFESQQTPGQVVFLIDVDEFVVLCEHASIGEFWASQAAGVDCMWIPWHQFGTSNLPEHPPGGSVPSTYSLRWSKKGLIAHHGKVAVRSPVSPIPLSPLHPEPNKFHHRCEWYEGANTVKVPRHHDAPNKVKIRIHHYFLRGGVKDALERRVIRGNSAILTSPTLNDIFSRVGVDHYDKFNEVADPTLLNVMAEYGPGLLEAKPPRAKRTHLPQGYCKRPRPPQAKSSQR